MLKEPFSPHGRGLVTIVYVVKRSFQFDIRALETVREIPISGGRQSHCFRRANVIVQNKVLYFITYRYSKNKGTVDLSLIPLICSLSILTILDAFAMNSKGISSANKKKTLKQRFSVHLASSTKLIHCIAKFSYVRMHSVHRLHMVSVHIDHHRRLAFRTLNKLSHFLSVRPLVMLIRSAVFVDTGHPDRLHF